jgi:FMN-dependent NADH-azoreductase
MQPLDFAEPFLRGSLGWLGMKDITTFRVEGTSIPQFSESALPKAVGQVNEYAF